MENKNPIWSRLWFVWLMLTIIYLLLYWSYFTATDGGGADPSLFAKLVFGIGLFVPYGFWNGYAFFASGQDVLFGPLADNSLFTFFVGIFVLLVVIFGHRIINLFNLEPVYKLAIALVILVFLTYLADYSIWQSWPSLSLFLGQENPFLINNIIK